MESERVHKAINNFALIPAGFHSLPFEEGVGRGVPNIDLISFVSLGNGYALNRLVPPDHDA